ncbi:toll/interleukin-1 receptor domain-containing protein [Rhizobium sp. BIGb0125]|uniref:toll/interleukin-1 receptor domain-containing protein n=1 Tax=Rhizobium sp. BIGb0125 TaxID=2940618 RepID=UPI002168DF5C|nr:toll/interleukin-1 receptor domain-containing protein [Rhizobium sp. BIGb0125]
MQFSSTFQPSSGGGAGSRASVGSGKTSRPKWARTSSTVWYTPAEVRELEPVREQIEARATVPDLRDVFLCHAWDDRQGAAKELCDLLEARGVKVWFSEKDIALGEPFLREIDRGLAKSRVGIVLVTPNFLKRIHGRSIADKELSVLLHGGKLVPVIHGTTFAELNEESPMLASRNGLSTAEDSMADVATKLADLVFV